MNLFLDQSAFDDFEFVKASIISFSIRYIVNLIYQQHFNWVTASH